MCSSGELGKEAGQLPGTGPRPWGVGKPPAAPDTATEDSGSRSAADHLGPSPPSP